MGDSQNRLRSDYEKHAVCYNFCVMSAAKQNRVGSPLSDDPILVDIYPVTLGDTTSNVDIYPVTFGDTVSN